MPQPAFGTPAGAPSECMINVFVISEPRPGLFKKGQTVLLFIENFSLLARERERAPFDFPPPWLVSRQCEMIACYDSGAQGWGVLEVYHLHRCDGEPAQLTLSPHSSLRPLVLGELSHGFLTVLCPRVRVSAPLVDPGAILRTSNSQIARGPLHWSWNRVHSVAHGPATVYSATWRATFEIVFSSMQQCNGKLCMYKLLQKERERERQKKLVLASFVDLVVLRNLEARETMRDLFVFTVSWIILFLKNLVEDDMQSSFCCPLFPFLFRWPSNFNSFRMESLTWGTIGTSCELHAEQAESWTQFGALHRARIQK